MKHGLPTQMTNTPTGNLEKKVEEAGGVAEGENKPDFQY